MGITDVLITELKKNIGQETGLSDWFEITQERVDAFAEAIEDRQWIHCDVEKAKAGPFGGTIVHGPLLISLLGHLGSPFHQSGSGRRPNQEPFRSFGFYRQRPRPVSVKSPKHDRS